LTLNFAGRPIGKFNFEQEVVCIGREPTCDVHIDNIGVSRRHATIERTEGRYVLKDLKSHNGTFVKGQKVQHHKLGDSDEFFIGKYSIEFETLDLSVQAPEPQAVTEFEENGMQDMTFRLDKTEIERLIGASAMANIPKLAQIAPEGEKWTVQLEGHYFLIGKHPKATIKLTGLFAPLFGGVMVRSAEAFHLICLNKRTGMKINGQKFLDQVLNDGDIIEIGKRKYRYALR
jgi:pSer/pThr/pTyr-binding forkhead associated (FHA) protein